jgi:hypothetical protein
MKQRFMADFTRVYQLPLSGTTQGQTWQYPFSVPTPLSLTITSSMLQKFCIYVSMSRARTTPPISLQRVKYGITQIIQNVSRSFRSSGMLSKLNW